MVIDNKSTNYFFMTLKFKSLIIINLLIFVLSLQMGISEGAKKRAKPKPAPERVQTSLVVDTKTGKVLHSQNANAKIFPASLAKGMTLYMLFEALATGKLSLDHQFYVSKNATKALPSKLYLKEGEKIKVRDAVLALVVKSANDVAYVIGENIAGSEQKFIKLMNQKAKQLGMHNTHFANASGWHDSSQVSTAADMARLYIAIKRDFPQYYHFCSKTNFIFKGKQVNGHNRVLGNYPGATGGKTGFTNPAGFNLVIEASRNNKNLIGVVTGSHSWAARDKKMVNLLDHHFGVKQDTIKTQKSTMTANSKKKSKNKVKVASNKR